MHIVIYLLFFVGGVFTQLKDGDMCVLEHTNIVGQCTPADQCVSAKNDFQLNGIRPSFCEHSFNQVLVCCRDGSSILKAAGPRTVVTNSSSTDKRRVSVRKCEEYSRIVTQKVEITPLLPGVEPFSLYAPDCTYSNVELVVGGSKANLGEFPHMAAIGWVDFDDRYKFDCGGSLISTKHVLTAGHCSRNPRAKDPKPSIVRLGDLNLDTSVADGANPLDVPINTLHIHPDYKPPKRYNDIAILELAADVDIDRNIRPACLWQSLDFGKHNIAYATGWGTTNPSRYEPINELQKVALTLLDNQQCDKLLKHSFNRLWQGFSESQLCAGDLRGGKDTCRGDSGGPLQVASSDNHCVFHIMGVTSFGNGCAQSGHPAVYTRVASYIDWMESVVWPGE